MSVDGRMVLDYVLTRLWNLMDMMTWGYVMLMVYLELDYRNHRDDDDEEVEVMDKLIQMT
jgi:hypothetical protein